MSAETETALEAALVAHLLDEDVIDPGSMIVGWTIVGEAIEPTKDIGTVKVFTARNSTLDPILEYGLLSTRTDDLRNQLSGDPG